MRAQNDVAPLRNYRKANGLDFKRLEELANRSQGVTFDTVLRRAMNGITDEAKLAAPTVLPATKDWLTMTDACAILCAKPGTLAGLWHRHPTALYWGIRAKTRSMKVKLGPNGAGSRGCGVLLYRPDLERVMEIKRAARLSLTNALRVFQAITEGKLKP